MHDMGGMSNSDLLTQRLDAENTHLNIHMEPRNHPFAKENHLPSTSIIVFHVKCPGCEQISDSALFKGKPYKFHCWKSRIIQAGFWKKIAQRCSCHLRWIPCMFYQFGQKIDHETTLFGVHKSPNITAVRIQLDDCFCPGKQRLDQYQNQ